jgi:hypothetical protein
MIKAYIRSAVMTAFLIGASGSLVTAEETGGSVLKLPQDIQFKGPLAGAPQTLVLIR